MSTYYAFTRHPRTGEWLEAMWIDNYFGQHRYGVQFADGEVFDPTKVLMPTRKVEEAEKDERQ